MLIYIIAHCNCFRAIKRRYDVELYLYMIQYAYWPHMPRYYIYAISSRYKYFDINL